jgi:hypothetical protein
VVHATDGVVRWFPRGSARPPGVKLTFHVLIRPAPPRSYARGDWRCAAGYARYSDRLAVGSEALGISPRTPHSGSLKPYPLPFLSSLSLISPVVWRRAAPDRLGFLMAATQACEQGPKWRCTEERPSSLLCLGQEAKGRADPIGLPRCSLAMKPRLLVHLHRERARGQLRSEEASSMVLRAG